MGRHEQHDRSHRAKAPRRSLAWALVAALTGAAAATLVAYRPVPQRGGPQVKAGFVGEATCASCHLKEAARWQKSHHQQAMQPATISTVLGDFADAGFTYGELTSTFFRRDGKPFARTDGPDGGLQDFEITHTFGVSPLQQYLVSFPKGRVQALEVAWDSRPSAEGGQRWFHLYPSEGVTHRDPLHWTGPTENWNDMCADCHSTNVRKGYDARSETYSTASSELSVSCEACHGPGSAHVAAAKEGRGAAGLTVVLDERKGIAWTRDPKTQKPWRSAPRATDKELDTCARCHSRRGLFHEDTAHGQALGDDYRVALLDEDLYYPDGQMRGEVYEYGSFVQSRMHAEGVTCSDCHDPHRAEARADDGTCLQCHAATYTSASHHFHKQGSTGAACVGCHMPTTTFMGVDARHDHSLRVPRPDLSVQLGVPNACNGCHADRSPSWAQETVETWYGHTPSGYQQFAQTLAASAAGAAGSGRQLAALAVDKSQPAIARATALARLAHRMTPSALGAVRAGLADPVSLVRRAAVEALSDTDPTVRLPLAAPLLLDPVREVRLAAAMALASVPVGLVPPPKRAALHTALDEYVAAQQLNADRPDAHLNLAQLYTRQQEPERAEAELKRALALDPTFVPAAVNLADLYRAARRDADAEPILKAALERVPGNPTLLYALGLLEVRERRLPEALRLLGLAARLAPGNPRYAYVHAVARDSGGERRGAITELEDVLRRHPNDRDTLQALVAFLSEQGELHRALQHAQHLEQLEPEDPQVQATTAALRRRIDR